MNNRKKISKNKLIQQLRQNIDRKEKKEKEREQSKIATALNTILYKGINLIIIFTLYEKNNNFGVF
jgi:hypothetical protein